MGWSKKKGDSKYSVFVYDPAIQRKRYVGRRTLEREAKALFREKDAEFRKRDPKSALTVGEYATEWLDVHHGQGTRRPKHSTWVVNRDYLKKFLIAFGDRPLDGIKRREALRWAKDHPYHAKTISAMFNDAVDDEECVGNPFANRRHEGARERKDIHPLTEAEVEQLAGIALDYWGKDGYGLTARAWVLFGAWVGCRPGETWKVTARDLNFADGTVTIRRVKKRGKVYPIDVVVLPDAAQDAIRAMPVVSQLGPVFTTVTGLPMAGSAGRWHWRPIRDLFRAKVSEERWQQLVEGQAKPTMDFYVCRHFAASIIVDRGGNEYDVAAQLGNGPEVCRDHYIHSYRDRVNERNREALNRPTVVDLDAAREKRGA